jgi:hypothetical protein
MYAAGGGRREMRPKTMVLSMRRQQPMKRNRYSTFFTQRKPRAPERS